VKIYSPDIKEKLLTHIVPGSSWTRIIAFLKGGLCKIREKSGNESTQNRDLVILFRQVPPFKRGVHIAFPELNSENMYVF